MPIKKITTFSKSLVLKIVFGALLTAAVFVFIGHYFPNLENQVVLATSAISVVLLYFLIKLGSLIVKLIVFALIAALIAFHIF